MTFETIIEPFRIKVVEQIKMTTPEQRVEMIRAAKVSEGRSASPLGSHPTAFNRAQRPVPRALSHELAPSPRRTR